MEMPQGNAEKKPAWNMLSNGDSNINPVMRSFSWPSLYEMAKTALCSNKSSSDSLKSPGDDGSSSSSFSFFTEGNILFAELKRKEHTVNEPIMDQEFIEQAVDDFANINVTNCTTAPPSGQSTSPRGQNQGNEFSSQSHVGTQNQHQRNSNMSQNVNHHPHQSHGGRHNQEHVNQNWNPQRNLNGRRRFSQQPRGGTQAFGRPFVPSFYAQHMPIQQLFYPIVFFELPPPMMYHPHRMPFPPPLLFPSQEAPFKALSPSPETLLKTKILNQVQYYFSEDNLPKDEYLRKRMNYEGFVHIELIAGFNKLKALTSDIQLILDSIQGSDVVELKGYEIRNKHVWRKYVLHCDLRIPFYPSPKYA